MFQGLQEGQIKGAIEAMLFVTDEPVGTLALADMLEALGASLRLGRSESLGGLSAEVRLPGRRDETVTAGRPPRAPPP